MVYKYASPSTKIIKDRVLIAHFCLKWEILIPLIQLITSWSWLCACGCLCNVLVIWWYVIIAVTYLFKNSCLLDRRLGNVTIWVLCQLTTSLGKEWALVLYWMQASTVRMSHLWCYARDSQPPIAWQPYACKFVKSSEMLCCCSLSTMWSIFPQVYCQVSKLLVLLCQRLVVTHEWARITIPY